MSRSEVIFQSEAVDKKKKKENLRQNHIKCNSYFE